MKKLIWLILFVVIISIPAYAFKWKKVGGDPYLGNAETAINKWYKLGYLTLEEKKEAIEIFKNHLTSQECIPRGGYLDLMESGHWRTDWSILCNWLNFSELDAEVAYVGDKKIIHYFAEPGDHNKMGKINRFIEH